jgi:hypothetical protein
MAKEILVAYGCDVDAVAGQIGSYAGGDSPCDISRGIFAGEVGTRRMLKLFKKHDIKTTWFIPGHAIETFPEDVTWAQALERIQIAAALDRAETEIDSGHCVSQSEAEAHIDSCLRTLSGPSAA